MTTTHEPYPSLNAETRLRQHPDLTATAFHESGHAVAALRSGLVLRSVDVIYTSDRFGAADYDHEHAPLETRALCLLAAGAAERRYTGSPRAHDVGDVDQLRVLFRGSVLDPDRPYAERTPAADAERQRIVNEWYAKAEAFVEREWMWIERVAQALQRRERLTGAEVKTLSSFPVVHIDPPPPVDEDALLPPPVTPHLTKSVEPEAAAEHPIDEFRQRLGIPDVNTDGVVYDGQRFNDAQQRYFDDPQTLTLDDIKLFAVVDARLGQIARAKQLGYVTPYTEEEQKALKVKVSYKAFYHWVAHWLSPTLSTYRHKTITAQSRLDALEQRVRALEVQPQLKHCGPWIEGQPYSEGNFVTRKGGMWLAMRPQPKTPGDTDSGWLLVVKEGKAA